MSTQRCSRSPLPTLNQSRSVANEGEAIGTAQDRRAGVEEIALCDGEVRVASRDEALTCACSDRRGLGRSSLEASSVLKRPHGANVGVRVRRRGHRRHLPQPNEPATERRAGCV